MTIKIDLHHLPRAARFLLALLAASTLFSATSAAQATRTDNRRLFWTGSNGATWDNSTASWMTSGSFLAYANINANSGVWLTTIPGTGEPVVADPNASFIDGDVAIFDGSRGAQTISIASGGVVASDVVVNAAVVTNPSDGSTTTSNYVFNGGGITADPARVAPGSVQITGTGVGLAAPATRPTGSLYKFGLGTLTLANSAPSVFPGGIHLMEGALSIADKNALGNNTIMIAYVVNQGGVVMRYGDFMGKDLLNLIQRPGLVAGGVVVPAVVMNPGGQLYTYTAPASGSEVTLHVAPSAAGLDITGDIYLHNRSLIFDIEGDTTVSGRLVGSVNDYGTNGGTIIKNGPGTLTLTNGRNAFYGASKFYNQLNEGRVVITNPQALGIGATSVNPGAVLEFRGVAGIMRQSFIGGGDIEITGGSDVTFNWRNGSLDGFEGMSGNGSWHPAMNDLSTVTISGQSRFSAIASGTYSTVLGGAGVYVKVTEGSTLVLGREGLSARGTGNTKIPMTYAILANRIDLSGASTIVLNPNAYLSTGALIVTDNSTCAITFGASGVSRLRCQEGIDPNIISTDPAPGAPVRYIVPAGMKLFINEIPVPVSPSQSIPGDSSSSGWCREYVLVNQGANPLKDIAMTMNTLDALHDTLSARLAEELIDPVTNHTPSKGRKWVNEGWARYIMSNIKYDSTSITTPGMTGRVNHFVGGFDALLPGRVLAGLHAGMGENNLDTTNDTTLRSKQKSIGLHAAQLFGKFHLAASADTGRAHTDSFRTEAGSTIRGVWDTTYYSAAVEAGAAFAPLEKLTLKPFASFRYSNFKIGGYYEKGLSPLVIGDFSDTNAQFIYGLAAGYKLTLFKRDIALNLSVDHRHSIKTPRSTLGTHYFDSPTTPVELERGDYYSDITAAGLSARVAVSRHTIVGIAVDYALGSSYDRLTGTVLVGYTW